MPFDELDEILKEEERKARIGNTDIFGFAYSEPEESSEKPFRPDYYSEDENKDLLNDKSFIMGRKLAVKGILQNMQTKYESEVLNKNALVTRRNNLFGQMLVSMISFIALFILLIYLCKRAISGAGAFNGVPDFFLAFFVVGFCGVCFKASIEAFLAYMLYMEKKPFHKYNNRMKLKTFRNMEEYHSKNLLDIENAMKPYRNLLKKMEEGKLTDIHDLDIIEDKEKFSIKLPFCNYKEEKARFFDFFTYLKG